MGDCAAHAALRGRGVEFRGGPVTADGSVHARFVDLYGNESVLVELRPA